MRAFVFPSLVHSTVNCIVLLRYHLGTFSLLLLSYDGYDAKTTKESGNAHKSTTNKGSISSMFPVTKSMKAYCRYLGFPDTNLVRLKHRHCFQSICVQGLPRS